MKGSILVSLLLVLSLVSTLVTIITFNSVKVSQRIQQQIHHDIHKNDLINSLLRISSFPPNQDTICSSPSKKTMSHHISSKICHNVASDNSILDLRYLLPTFKDCPNPKLAPFSQTITGKIVSIGSVISPLLCTSLPILNSSNYTLEGNIDLLSDTLLDRDLFNSGYFSSTSALHINKDYGLIAGGDIILNKVDCSNPNGCTLYLNSRQGTISYIEASPNLTVYCEAKFSICPNGIIGRPPNQPWINHYQFQILGIN